MPLLEYLAQLRRSPFLTCGASAQQQSAVNFAVLEAVIREPSLRTKEEERVKYREEEEREMSRLWVTNGRVETLVVEASV